LNLASRSGILAAREAAWGERESPGNPDPFSNHSTLQSELQLEYYGRVLSFPHGGGVVVQAAGRTPSLHFGVPGFAKSQRGKGFRP